MSLFQEAKNEQAYLKMSLFGFPGSGKTYTACDIAIGLHKYIKSDKPITFFDTETGSDFHVHRFQDEGIKLLTAKTRAFSDLMSGLGEAQQLSDIVIIDSTTHYWNDLMTSFLKKRKKDRLSLPDIMYLKREWQPFSEWIVNSKMHVITCGRAGWEFDNVEDEEGFQVLTKTGTKQKVESDFGYEPSLICEMVRQRVSGDPGAGWLNRMWVLKDRGNKINGKFFDKPTFKSILPHIELLAIGGSHVGFDGSRDSQGLFDSKSSRNDEIKQKKIYLEEIESEFVSRWPSNSKEDRQNKIDHLKKIFGTTSWTAIEDLPSDILQVKLMEIRSLPNGNT